MRLPIVLTLMLAASSVHAQGVELRLADTGAARAFAHVGDTLTVEVALDLGGLRVSGVALHVRLPSRGLAVLQGGQARPFEPDLFAEGVEFANQAVPPDQAYGVPPGSALLTYAVVLGPGESRYRSGSGSVATFDVVCTEPVDAAGIHLFSNPIHTSMVVLDDGRTELALVETSGIELEVGEPAAKRTVGSWGAVKARSWR